MPVTCPLPSCQRLCHHGEQMCVLWDDGERLSLSVSLSLSLSLSLCFPLRRDMLHVPYSAVTLEVWLEGPPWSCSSSRLLRPLARVASPCMPQHYLGAAPRVASPCAAVKASPSSAFKASIYYTYLITISSHYYLPI